MCQGLQGSGVISGRGRRVTSPKNFSFLPRAQENMHRETYKHVIIVCMRVCINLHLMLFIHMWWHKYLKKIHKKDELHANKYIQLWKKMISFSDFAI